MRPARRCSASNSWCSSLRLAYYRRSAAGRKRGQYLRSVSLGKDRGGRFFTVQQAKFCFGSRVANSHFPSATLVESSRRGVPPAPAASGAHDEHVLCSWISLPKHDREKCLAARQARRLRVERKLCTRGSSLEDVVLAIDEARKLRSRRRRYAVQFSGVNLCIIDRLYSLEGKLADSPVRRRYMTARSGQTFSAAGRRLQFYL
jgi:hypothetical protein